MFWEIKVICQAPPEHKALCVVLTFYPVPALTLRSRQYPNISVLGQFHGQPHLWRALKNLLESWFKPLQPSREWCWHRALQNRDTQPHFHTWRNFLCNLGQEILFIFHHRKQIGRGLARVGILRGKAREEDDELQLYRYKWHPWRGRKIALRGGGKKR